MIYAPSYFGSRELGQTTASEPEKILNRVVATSLYSLTDDFSKQYLMLRFKVIKVHDTSVETVFFGHEYGREYLRSLVRRGSTRIDGIFKVVTKDGYTLRLTVSAFTLGRSRSKRNKAIRAVMKSILETNARNFTFDQFVQELVLGKTSSDVYNEARKIGLLRHVGVIKSKVIALPMAAPELGSEESTSSGEEAGKPQTSEA